MAPERRRASGMSSSTATASAITPSPTTTSSTSGPGARPGLHRPPHALRRPDAVGPRRSRRRRGTASPRSFSATAASASRRPSRPTASSCSDVGERRGHAARRRSTPASRGPSRPSPSTSTRSSAIRPRLNVAALVGHTPLRFFVMGDDASERAATARRDRPHAGAGRRGPRRRRHRVRQLERRSHVGAYGEPVPSRVARSRPSSSASAEPLARAGTAASSRSTWGPDFYVDDWRSCRKRIGRPVSWAALADQRPTPRRDARSGKRRLGGDVWPQIACRPIVVQLTLTDPFAFRHRRRVHRDPRARPGGAAGALRERGVAPARPAPTCSASSAPAATGSRCGDRDRHPRRSSTARCPSSRPTAVPTRSTSWSSWRWRRISTTASPSPWSTTTTTELADAAAATTELAARAVRRRRPHQPAVRRQLRHLPAEHWCRETGR